MKKHHKEGSTQEEKKAFLSRVLGSEHEMRGALIAYSNFVRYRAKESHFSDADMMNSFYDVTDRLLRNRVIAQKYADTHVEIQLSADLLAGRRVQAPRQYRFANHTRKINKIDSPEDIKKAEQALEEMCGGREYFKDTVSQFQAVYESYLDKCHKRYFSASYEEVLGTMYDIMTSLDEAGLLHRPFEKFEFKENVKAAGAAEEYS